MRAAILGRPGALAPYLGQEKTSSVIGNFLAAKLPIIVRNATVMAAPKSEALLALKRPVLGAKLYNVGRNLRIGKSTGRGVTQQVAEDVMFDPMTGSAHNVLESLGEGVRRIKQRLPEPGMQGPTFMHTPDSLNRITGALEDNKQNLRSLKEHLKEMEAQIASAETTPGAMHMRSLLVQQRRGVIKGIEDEQRRFDANLVALRKERLIGDVPMEELLQETRSAALDKAVEQGYDPVMAQLGADALDRKLRMQLEIAGIDPVKENVRDAQDKLFSYAKDSIRERHEALDEERSPVGAMLARGGRFLLDPSRTSAEGFADLLGGLQLDDVYDPLAKNRAYAQGVQGLGRDLLSLTGRSTYDQVVRPLAETKALTNLREGISEGFEASLRYNPFQPGFKPVAPDISAEEARRRAQQAIVQGNIQRKIKKKKKKRR